MWCMSRTERSYEGVEVPDYYGEDGLLHCGVCHEPKEAYLPEGKEWLGRKIHPRMCLCDRTEYERQEKREKQLEHEKEVSRLREKCFSDIFQTESFPSTSFMGTHKEHFDEN